MNSDNGYEKPSLFNPKGTLQVPSNVTRISRCFKRRCSDGKVQVISYESGVGTGSNAIDSLTGGAFGLGLTEVSISKEIKSVSTKGRVKAHWTNSGYERHTRIYAQTIRMAMKSSWSVSLVEPLQFGLLRA